MFSWSYSIFSKHLSRLHSLGKNLASAISVCKDGSSKLKLNPRSAIFLGSNTVIIYINLFKELTVLRFTVSFYSSFYKNRSPPTYYERAYSSESLSAGFKAPAARAILIFARRLGSALIGSSGNRGIASEQI